MKPRWSECHPRTHEILAKAKELEERVTKASEATEGSQTGPSHFEIETGGRIAHRPQYWTNQSTIEVEDITQKSPAAQADPVGMMKNPPHDYGPTGSTLHDHESGGEGAVDLKKSNDTVLGSLKAGDGLRLRKVAEAAEDLARRLS